MLRSVRVGIMLRQREYYAVRVGRNAGIYDTWDDCKKEVEGFSGAAYKKFKTEDSALEFLKAPEPVPQPPQVQNNWAPPIVTLPVVKSINLVETITQPTAALPEAPEVIQERIAKNRQAALAKKKRTCQLSEEFQTPTEKLQALNPQEQLAMQKKMTKSRLEAQAKLKKKKAMEDVKGNPDSKITVWTDGACRGNGKASAIAGIGVWFGDQDPRNLSERIGGRQTNQRAELLAAFRCLQEIKKSSPGAEVEIRTDSIYVIKGITEWIINWKANNWQKTKVQNKDLWLDLDAVVQGMKISWVHVKGHSGDYGNEQADKLAVDACLNNPD